MDKETLSNYGWIVILVLILAVMIALATPFGNFIAEAIKSTTAGFFSVNENALGAAGITIPGQEFQDTKDGVENVELITFYHAGTPYQAKKGMTWREWINSKYNTVGGTIDIDELDGKEGACIDSIYVRDNATNNWVDVDSEILEQAYSDGK